MKRFSLLLVISIVFALNINAKNPTGNSENQEEQEIIYSYYTIVVGSFADTNNAKKFADKVKAQGFEPYFRKNEAGNYYRVCVYRLSSEQDAEKRLQKLKNIEYIFFKAWVLGYDRISENINYGQL